MSRNQYSHSLSFLLNAHSVTCVDLKADSEILALSPL